MSHGNAKLREGYVTESVSPESVAKMKSSTRKRKEKNVEEYVEIQWVKNGDSYFYTGETQDKIPPGIYVPVYSDRWGYGFKSMYDMPEDIIDLNTKSYNSVVDDIARFWKNEQAYIDNGFSYRRGILMYGPQGCGKSFLIKRLSRDLMTQYKGITVLVDDPQTYSESVQILKKLEPETRILAVFEDFDELIRSYNQSKFLQIFDGMETVDNVVNIVTTNQPDAFHERIVNRPGRFDIRCEITLPSKSDKSAFLQRIGTGDLSKTDADTWADYTPNFTYAHLKELYVSVKILKYPLTDALDRLVAMFRLPRVEKIEASSNAIKFGVNHK